MRSPAAHCRMSQRALEEDRGIGLRYHSNLFKTEDPPMAQPNFAFEKRQRELAKKRKKEEKAKRKVETGAPAQDDQTAEQAPPAEQQPAE